MFLNVCKYYWALEEHAALTLKKSSIIETPSSVLKHLGFFFSALRSDNNDVLDRPINFFTTSEFAFLTILSASSSFELVFFSCILTFFCDDKLNLCNLESGPSSKRYSVFFPYSPWISPLLFFRQSLSAPKSGKKKKKITSKLWKLNSSVFELCLITSNSQYRI